MKDIKLGYEVESGEAISIKPSHIIVTGITQESGKTTTLQALIKRGKFKAIIFKTKIGEKGITEGSLIPPYYKDDFDWEYASDLLESSRKEKMKFERSWIIDYATGATSLLEFSKNIDDGLANGISPKGFKVKDWDRRVLVTLQAYLKKILPELQYAPLSNTLDIKHGINIMDLERFKEETQSLIIRAVLKEVLRKEKNTVVVIPEAWKYIPEGRGNPVKRDAEAFIRQGASNKNYLWIDSQDITGVDKTVLKQVSTWILGYQREINEIKRTLDQLPIPKHQKPKSNDIANLKVGHFYVATSDFTKKVYVQPSWLNDKTAKKVALGKKDVSEIKPPTSLTPFSIVSAKPKETETVTIDLQPLKKDMNELRNDFFNKIQQQQEAINKVYSELFALKTSTPTVDEDSIIAKVLQKMPLNNMSGSPQFDEESLIQKVLSRVPKVAGGVTYEVAPLEKIQKDFLEEAKNKLLSVVSTLDEKQKIMLKWIEQKGTNSTKKDIFYSCFGKSATSGGTYTSLVGKLTDMKQKEIIVIDTHNRVKPHLKQRIEQLISQYGASVQDIQQVYDHILMEVLKNAN